jgi:ABC-type thiamin/hydroxymethylpyrimidine transport system permease subunit
LSVVSLTVGVVTMVCLWASLGVSTAGLFQRLGLTTTDVWLMATGFAAVVGRLSGDKLVGQGVRDEGTTEAHPAT